MLVRHIKVNAMRDLQKIQMAQSIASFLHYDVSSYIILIKENLIF